jgi:hypothetical protein
MTMIKTICAIALTALACAAASPAPAQDALPWPQCAPKPRCASGSAASCTAQGTCVVPAKRPHRGCLQYSCVKESWKAREEELERARKDRGPTRRACTGGRIMTASGCGCPPGRAFIGGQCVMIDYGGAPSRPNRPAVR